MSERGIIVKIYLGAIYKVFSKSTAGIVFKETVEVLGRHLNNISSLGWLLERLAGVEAALRDTFRALYGSYRDF